jgi:ArsR family transcriptional regulator
MTTSMAIRALPVRHRADTCCVEPAPAALTEQQTAGVAERLKVAGDPTRLRLLDLLAQQAEPLCVCDLTPAFPQNQPTISHHLKLLREAGLIDTEKRGIWGYYWATDEGRRMLKAVQSLV